MYFIVGLVVVSCFLLVIILLTIIHIFKVILRIIIFKNMNSVCILDLKNKKTILSLIRIFVNCFHCIKIKNCCDPKKSKQNIDFFHFFCLRQMLSYELLIKEIRKYFFKLKIINGFFLFYPKNFKMK